MLRLRSSLASVWLLALLLMTASAVRAQEPNWQLIDAPPDTSTTASEAHPPNPTHHVYILHGDAGVFEAPIPETVKEDLVPLVAQEPGVISVSTEEEVGDTAYIVSKEIAEGLAISEQNGQLTPELAAIAEPADEETSSSASAVGTNSLFGSCATKDYLTARSYDLSQVEPFEKSFDIGDDGAGFLKMTGNLDGTVHGVIRFGIKRKAIFGVCIPYGVKVYTIHIYGDATTDNEVTLHGRIHAQQSIGPKEIAKPVLYTYPVNLYYITIYVGISLPITTGLDVTADVFGDLDYTGKHVATGTFDYTCTLDNCSGTSDFDNGSTTGAQEVTAAVDGHIKPNIYLDIGVRGWIYSDSAISAQIGLRANFLGDLWGYAGNTCGDADGDGFNETVDALTFDLDRRIDITGRVSVLGAKWNRTIKTGTPKHVSFWDLGGSTAMQPQLHGPSPVMVDTLAGPYKVKIRPCWPYTDNVTYRINWGDGGPTQDLTGAPGVELEASHTWATAGTKTVAAASASDAHGRVLDQPYARDILVKPWEPITLTVTPSPGSVPQGGTVTWTATAAGGDSSTMKYALFRRHPGTTVWTPDVTQPNWQSGGSLSWTTSAADLGVWEIIVWAKDSHTPATMNTYGYAAYANAGPVEVVPPLVLSCPAPVTKTVTYGTPLSWTLSTTGGTPGTIQFAMARNLAGTSTWVPNPYVWQTSPIMSWTPTAADLGTWTIYAGVKDVNSPANPGYTANCNLGQYRVVAPLAVSVTPSPASVVHGNAVSWTATATGGAPESIQYAFFRRLAGTTPWTPDVTQAAWQTSGNYSWTPTANDVGTWEIVVWVKDATTPASTNTYGFAAYANAGPVKVVRPPLTLSVTPSPSSSTAGNAITWTATAGGGNPATTQYAFFRRLAGTTPWTPDVTQAAWQTSPTFSWTPTTAQTGTWEIYVWVKDGDTPATMNTYGYAAGANAGPVNVVGPIVLSCPAAVTKTVYSGTALSWTVSSTGGVPGTVQYAFGRQLAGTTTWLPNPSVWQAGTSFNWTPAASDAGTWSLVVAAKDANSPASTGYSTFCNLGSYKVVAAPSVSVTASPASIVYGNAINWTATASGGTAATTQYAFFRRRAGTTPWTPDVTAPNWQAGNAFSWTPTSADVGTWEIIVWMRDGDTPATMNTYGFAAYANAGPVNVVRPALTLAVTSSPTYATSGNAITWTATATGGDPATRKYALFRRRAGTTPWTPDVTAPAWQTSNVLSWTPTSADTGTWEIIVWVKDGDTTATQNTYGYAAYANAGPVQVVAPLSVTGSGSPAYSVYGNTITWTASASGGVPSTYQYAFFRRRAGTTPWTPDVTQAAWQSSGTFNWTPSSADTGTWEIIIWAKDGNTPATMNTYGYAAYYNAQPVQVVAPLTLSCSVSPSTTYSGETVSMNANASGGVTSTRQYAFFRRRAGATAWIPAATSPAWQNSNSSSWTPAPTDTGTWETYVWVKDSTTPSSQNTYGYAAGCNSGLVQVVTPPSLSVTGSPSSSPYGATLTWTASSSGGTGSTVRYAFFRRLAGTSTWTPSVNSPNWQTSNTYSWTPTSADVGTWETYVWMKDSATPSGMNTYGYAAGFNSGPVQVVTPAPLTVSGSGSPSTSPAGTQISWTANTSGGVPSTVKYALFRRLAGTSNWIPDVTAPSWQTSNVLRWTPSASDVGTWEIIIWVKDVNTSSTQNTYGFAAYYNAQPVQVY
jgi:hypothetical protein